jgi:hypothetical protein
MMSVKDILRYLQQLYCDMKISVISIGDKVTGTADTTVV